MKKLAIICQFSYPSACGVWATIENILPYLRKKYEVHIFSSNQIKGTNKISSSFEKIEGVFYHRFPVKFSISENATYWDFKSQLIKLKPDIIHTHVYRHPHSTKALKIAIKLKVPCFLTTHAPFLDSKFRKPHLNILIKFYDFFIGRTLLKRYTKVIAITKWEINILNRIGCHDNNLVFIPNGVDELFFKIPLKIKKQTNIIYMGRIAPIKNLEIFNKLALDFNKLSFLILGPLELGYNIDFKSKNIKLINKKYDRFEEFKYLKKSDIFVLPSYREANPLVLMEAMAAGKVVISSNTAGARELLQENNGFIFRDYDELKTILNNCIDNYSNLIPTVKNARKFAEKRTWHKISMKIIDLYK